MKGPANLGIGGLNNTNAVEKTETELKALAGTLGEVYTNDEQNPDGTWKYNEGYPILKWQIKK